MLTCQYCLKECKNKNSLSSHEIRCNKNANRIAFHPENLKSFNQNYQNYKNDKNDLCICKFCGSTFQNSRILGGHSTLCNKNPNRQETIRKAALKNRGQIRTLEQRNTTSKSMKLAVLKGTQRTPKPGGILTGSWYTMKNGDRCYLHGSWEVAVAKFMDSKNINWKRNKQLFPYIFNGSTHSYIPDFYIVDFDFYVEVKGYETDKDRAKWGSFPHTLKIIRFKEFSNLDLWYQSIFGPMTQLVSVAPS